MNDFKCYYRGIMTLILFVLTGRMADVSVSDNGCGINHDKLEKIFQPFYRINIDSEMGGTGLGLSIARNLVEMMNGSIKVESVVGKGSTFNFTLPFDRNTGKKPAG